MIRIVQHLRRIFLADKDENVFLVIVVCLISVFIFKDPAVQICDVIEASDFFFLKQSEFKRETEEKEERITGIMITAAVFLNRIFLSSIPAAQVPPIIGRTPVMTMNKSFQDGR